MEDLLPENTSQEPFICIAPAPKFLRKKTAVNNDSETSISDNSEVTVSVDSINTDNISEDNNGESDSDSDYICPNPMCVRMYYSKHGDCR